MALIEEDNVQEEYRTAYEWTSFYKLSDSLVNLSIMLNMMISRIWYAHVGRGAMRVDGCLYNAAII